MYVPEEECAPHDPTVKIVGLPGQTRGSIGVIVERGKRGGKGVTERLGFTGGTVGFNTQKEVRVWWVRWVTVSGQPAENRFGKASCVSR